MTNPKSTKAKILYTLLKGKRVSERLMNFNSYRSRLSDLERKHGITLKEEYRPFKNVFGHKGQYKEKWLAGWKNINHAYGVYQEINK